MVLHGFAANMRQLFEPPGATLPVELQVLLDALDAGFARSLCAAHRLLVDLLLPHGSSDACGLEGP